MTGGRDDGGRYPRGTTTGPGGRGAPRCPWSRYTGGPSEERRRIMPLIHVVIVLVVVGVLLWLVNTYLPMDAQIKSILNIVIVIAVVLWLLSAFGGLGSLSHIPLGEGS